MKIKHKVRVRFAELLNLDYNVKNKRTWGSMAETINISAKDNLGHYELQLCKPSGIKK
jgi:hypothetical protein